MSKRPKLFYWRCGYYNAIKAAFVKLRQNVDFETGFRTITAILDVELVVSRKHTKYFALTDALKLEEMLAFHWIDSSNTKDDSRIPFSFISEEG
jgi:hypothetical protein